MALARVLRLLACLLLIVYMLSPIVFKYSPFIQRSLIFMNHVNTQFGLNLSQPEQLDLRCTRNLRLAHRPEEQLITGSPPPHETIELGVWHILPQSSLQSCLTDTHTNRTSIPNELAFADSRPIVLYVHGNGGSRGGQHRAQLYRKLAYQFNYHVVTFDYRGYGDSTYLRPSAQGLSADASFIYHWLLKQPNVNKGRLIVWGHSLGTGVAVNMIAQLSQPIRPSRLVLEAPFDTIAQAIASHIFSIPFKLMPYFEYYFVEPIVNSPELNFDTVQRIASLTTTYVIILHAEDDVILPIHLGRNLYKRAVEQLGQSRVQMITISAEHGLGHKHICNHEPTMTLVDQWINNH